MECAGVHLVFWDSGLKTLHGLVWVIHWHRLCIIASCWLGRFCPQRFLSLTALRYLDQPRWWSFTMCGWTDTALMVSTWFLLPKHPEQCPGVGAYTELKYLLFYADKWVLVDPIAAWDSCPPMTSAAAILHPAHININQWGGNFQLATAGCELQWWRNRICFISCCRGSNLRQKGRAERWRWAMP